MIASFSRRLLFPALFTLAGLAVLISLGVWQLHRKEWKEGLIATLERQITAKPVSLPDPSSDLLLGNAEFRRIALRAEFIKDAKPALLYTGASALREDVKQPGYFVFSPARLADGRAVVINRGYVPLDRTTEIADAPGEITGYLRFPEKPGWFVAAHDTKGEVWFQRDPQAMAEIRQWGPVAPFYIDQEAPVPAGGLPRPGKLAVHLRNDHLGYALTWFGLAGALAAVFAAWAIREWYLITSSRPPASL
ncbi:MAG: SURF1 family protein [Pseudorhodoplanes sp.]